MRARSRLIRCSVLAALTVLLLSVLCPFALAGVLTLPEAVTVIDAEAFCGDPSIDEVVLPEGIRRIESRAFAGTPVRKVNFPASLEYIAEDAFDDLDQVEIDAGPFSSSSGSTRTLSQPRPVTLLP